jgi:hypothetical protein
MLPTLVNFAQLVVITVTDLVELQSAQNAQTLLHIQ